MSGGALLYDGDCGFCTWYAAFVARRFRRPSSSCLAWQGVENLDHLGLGVDVLSRQAAWVACNGQVELGHRAIGRSLQACGGLLWIVGWAINRPLLEPIATSVYGWVARNRHGLSKTVGVTCSVPVADRAMRGRSGSGLSTRARASYLHPD